MRVDISSIVFMTGAEKNDLLERLIASGENLIAVILPFSSTSEERLAPVIEVANRHGLPIHRPRRTELPELLNGLSPDLLLSAGYPYLLNEEVLAIPAFCLNVHPTLLPKYRGAMTSWHIIANGERESGVTVHFIDRGMDTGNILVQEKIPLTPFDTVNSHRRKTSDLEPETLLKALQKLREGDSVGTPQDESKATVYPKSRKPEDSAMDTARSLDELYDFIRACDPDRFPAYMDVDGERVGVRLFRLEKPEGEDDMV